MQKEDVAKFAVFIKGKEHASPARWPLQAKMRGPPMTRTEQRYQRKILSDFRSSRQSKRAEIALMRAQTIAILIIFTANLCGWRAIPYQFAHFFKKSSLARPLQTTAAANKQRWPVLSANN